MNKWLSILFFLCCCYNLSAQEINKAEYFFDTDPGVGNGHQVSITTAADTIRTTFPVSSAGLSEGMHALYIRSMNANGWGHFEKFPFYISNTLNAPNLNEGEYFIDADPGAGNAHHIAVAGNSDTIRMAITVSSAGLTAGMHSLNTRFKDVSGNYSHYESSSFYITNEIPDMPKIVAAEYFFNTDPGVGMGTAINISPAADTVLKSFSIPVDCQNTEDWNHLYIRVKDEAGNWSHMETDSFKLHGPNTVVTLHAGLWSDATVWSNGVVPDANTQIILNYSITVDINASCKSLFTHCNIVTINAGKQLLVTGAP
ncbi:MAG: hypothetical protein ABI402_18425 [Ferruginibacter sp.]